MKKTLVVIACILGLGGILYQNQGRIFLMLLAKHNLGNPLQSIISANSNKPHAAYKDGSYTGSAQDAFYGNIQVKAVIQNGKITDIQFVQSPNGALRSVAINTIADPNLKQEAIQAQSANVEIVSGATDSSQAFIQSLQSALNQAQ